MRKAVIVSAVRTAVGKFEGSLRDKPAVELGAVVIQEAIRRADVRPEDVEEVIMGNVLQAGLGQGPARQTAIGAGIPVEVPAMTINKVCGSGLKAIALGAQAVCCGEADIIVAGGMENMTLAPYLLRKARSGYRLGNGELIDSMVHDGLWEIFNDYHMGVAAENLAVKYKIAREEQDRFAFESHNKALQAIAEGRFRGEIVPVSVPQRKGDDISFDTDEHPRSDTTIEKLAKLKPAFAADGTVTAGNASGINDGAAAVVVMSEEKARRLNIQPLAAITAYACAGVKPELMGEGPIPAIGKVLKRAEPTLEDIDLIEINEAFAVQTLAVVKALEIKREKLNVNGGAVALGHPIGASGARILVTLIHEMIRRDVKRGLASLCIGGGMGIAMIVER